MRAEVRAVDGVPRLSEGDELGSYLPHDADVVAVASTAVSKVEGRVRPLDGFEPSERAESLAERNDADPRFTEAVLNESTELLIEEPFFLAVTRFGHVAPNAGIDRSNVEGDGNVVLLPEDPGESAGRIADTIGTPVVVTDTCGRAFRRGQTGVAVGWACIDAVRDWRGEEDLHGHELKATEEAVVDEIAGFANAAMGEGGGGTPAVAFYGVEAIVGSADDDTVFRREEDDIVRSALLDFKP
ncbi:coenzyme F420-0:L-glutamate ligase [Haladaptatus sp. F3-133]|uniref:Coenzyme F420-0:L-glutamate ligase n=1 Tax=Halorutilus salinus TaxID=2487751 RepID=A0A9Q4C520_9EURY|nr:coenzyme F420-0:L-glutamate ligase [Halorutilus salinus]MCX2819197.1 coenzyme F420-0:L-glutamate ligase [Halorutilus salinus]